VSAIMGAGVRWRGASGIVTALDSRSAQRKVKGRNFDSLAGWEKTSRQRPRRDLQQRNDILYAKDLSAQIAALREGCFTDLVTS